MADDNKLQFDLELNEGSIESSFGSIDKRAEKSAKASAAVFGEAFQKQEQELQDSIARLVDSTRKVAQKSAKESADVFRDVFSKQDAIYKASVKQNIDNAIATLTNTNAVKKSAQESASVFEEAFKKQITGFKPLDNFLNAVLPDKILGGLKINGLADLAGGFFLLKQGIDLAEKAFSGFVDVTLAGESKLKLENRFTAMATQAGVAADVLRNDLDKAVKGLVDDDALLNLASQSFVKIGENARQLPQILEAARKTYKVFGGDVVSNADQIINAVETGNKKSLRSIGLYTDLEGAVKTYARQLGTVPALLSEQQIEQARLNAILDVANARYKNVDTGSVTATDAVTRLKVGVKELGDQISIFASNSFAKTLADMATSAQDFLKKVNQGFEFVNKPAESLDKINFQIKILTGSIKSAEDQLKNFNAVERFFLGDDFTKKIEENKKQLEDYQKKLAAATASQNAASGGNAATPSGSGTPAGPSEEYIKRKQELVNKVLELDRQVSQSNLQALQEQHQIDQAKVASEQYTADQVAQLKLSRDALTKAELLQSDMNYEQQKAQLLQFYAENGVNDQALKNQGIEDLEKLHQKNMLSIKTKGEQDKLKTQKAADAAAYNATSTALSQIATLQENASGELAAIGKAAAITKATMDGYVAVQNALAQVPYPFNFAAAALVGVAAAANVAKIAGIGGGGSAAFSPSTEGGGIAGGGGGIGATSPVAEVIAPADTVAQTPQTAINLTINGNVLDRRQTGLEIAQILEEQFSEQGLTIRGA